MTMNSIGHLNSTKWLVVFSFPFFLIFRSSYSSYKLRSTKNFFFLFLSSSAVITLVAFSTNVYVKICRGVDALNAAYSLSFGDVGLYAIFWRKWFCLICWLSDIASGWNEWSKLSIEWVSLKDMHFFSPHEFISVAIGSRFHVGGSVKKRRLSISFSSALICHVLFIFVMDSGKRR